MGTQAHLLAVVDDEELVRNALGRLLRAAGFRVALYDSGVGFMRSAGAPEPDCVLLDLHMPMVDGFDVQQALRQRSAHFPVVMLSGDDDAGSRERALQLGAVAFLRKPVDEAVLLATVRDALDRRA